MKMYTPADEPTATYQPPNPDPAIELMATLAQVNAHTTARQQLIELANRRQLGRGICQESRGWTSDKSPRLRATALALAKAAKAAGVPRLARWGERLEAAIEAQGDQDPTVKNAYPFVKTGD